MVREFLYNALQKAETPRGIKAAVWALEKYEGIRTVDLVTERKGVSIAPYTGPSVSLSSLPNADGYVRSGFYGVARALGIGSVGGNITTDSALESGAVYACSKILGEDLGNLPAFLIERSEDGKSQEKAYAHQLFRVLHDQPNPEMGAGEFREAMIGRASLGIDAIARIERTTRGVPVLWPVQGTVRVERDRNNQPIYYLKEGNAAEKDYRRDQIFNLRGFTLDGYCTDPILVRARHILGLTLAAQERAVKFHANDATPGLIIERPVGVEKLGPAKIREAREAWLDYHQASRGMSDYPAFLQDGAKAYRVDPDHQKLQMLESRKFQVVEVARIMRMPLDKLGDLDRATFSNIEQMDINYAKYTLMPWKRRFEEAVERCCLTMEERYWPNGRQRFYVSLSLEKLLQGDFKTQTEGFRSLASAAILTPNEIRAWFDLNPYEGGDGHFLQINMQDVTEAANAALRSMGPQIADQAVKKMMVELMEQKLIAAPQEVTQ